MNNTYSSQWASRWLNVIKGNRDKLRAERMAVVIGCGRRLRLAGGQNSSALKAASNCHEPAADEYASRGPFHTSGPVATWGLH